MSKHIGLILPGIGNSGAAHWQSRWEAQHTNHTALSLRRIHQTNWDAPVCAQWVQSLEQHVESSGSGTILIAHSLACLMVAHWASKSFLTKHIHAALLVAVPDPESSAFPAAAHGFSPLPMSALPFNTVMLSSNNDTFSGPIYSERIAQAWRCQHQSLGDLGHINAKSNLGDWADGWSILNELLTVTQ